MSVAKESSYSFFGAANNQMPGVSEAEVVDLDPIYGLSPAVRLGWP